MIFNSNFLAGTLEDFYLRIFGARPENFTTTLKSQKTLIE